MLSVLLLAVKFNKVCWLLFFNLRESDGLNVSSGEK